MQSSVFWHLLTALSRKAAIEVVFGTQMPELNRRMLAEILNLQMLQFV